MLPAGEFPPSTATTPTQGPRLTSSLFEIEMETVYQSRWSVPKVLYLYVRAIILAYGTVPQGS
jgi:hypothetical protein